MQGVFEENFKIGTCRAGKSLGFGVSDVCMAMLQDKVPGILGFP